MIWLKKLCFILLFFAWKKGIFFCYDLAFTVSQKQQQQVFVAFSKESHQKFVVGFCNEICQPRGKSYRRKDRLYFSSIPPRIPIVLQASIPQVSFGGGSSSLFWKLHRLRKKKRRGWTHINLRFSLYWNAIEQYKKEWGRSGVLGWLYFFRSTCATSGAKNQKLLNYLDITQAHLT